PHPIYHLYTASRSALDHASHPVPQISAFDFSPLFFFNDTATTEIYTLSLHDALPIWRHRARGDHGHHTDERLQQHRAVADEAGMAFAKDHLRRGTGRNQRMESADGAARNGDEAKGENLSGKDRAGSVDEARERRH